MFKIFRKPRSDALNNKQLGRYLRYATGEILLVIIGILIALQIDNWNNDRRESATLDYYLNSIARNVQSDLAELNALRERRQDNLLNMSRVQLLTNKLGDYEINDIYAFSRSVDLALRSLYFIPETSGYEALKNSGVLDKLQGREIEQTMSGYYDVLGNIQRLESEYNSSIKSLGSVFEQSPQEFYESWMFFNPHALSPEQFQEVQPNYRETIRGMSARRLFGLLASDSSIILAEYEKAIATGNKLIRMASSLGNSTVGKANHFNGVTDSTLAPGNPDLVKAGAIAFDSYLLSTTGSNNYGQEFTPDFAERKGDALYLSYPGSDFIPGVESWAVIWLSVNDTAFGRPHRDFSVYDTLQLELKGSLGGERLLLNLKDKDDPDDGSQTNIELILTDQWQTYDIDLKRFVTADLRKLHVVTGFLFLQQYEPISFWIRNARFIDRKVN